MLGAFAPPTSHVPVTPKKIEYLGPNAGETNDAFYKSVDTAALSDVYA